MLSPTPSIRVASTSSGIAGGAIHPAGHVGVMGIIIIRSHHIGLWVSCGDEHIRYSVGILEIGKSRYGSGHPWYVVKRRTGVIHSDAFDCMGGVVCERDTGAGEPGRRAVARGAEVVGRGRRCGQSTGSGREKPECNPQPAVVSDYFRLRRNSSHPGQYYPRGAACRGTEFDQSRRGPYSIAHVTLVSQR